MSNYGLMWCGPMDHFTNWCGPTIRHQVAYATLWRPKLYQCGAALPSGTRWPMPPSGGPNSTNVVRPYHQAPGGLCHPLEAQTLPMWCGPTIRHQVAPGAMPPSGGPNSTNVVRPYHQAPGGLCHPLEAQTLPMWCGPTIRHQVACATLWRPKLYQCGAALPSGLTFEVRHSNQCGPIQ